MAAAHDLRPQPQPTSRYFLLAAFILLAGFAVRIIRLDAAPLYLDEATHIWWAQRALTHGELWSGAVFNKLLFPLVVAVFRPLGPEAPFVGRLVSAFAGLVSVAGCVALGRTLDSRRAGLLAGALYAFVGLAVFHERQALADPLMATLTTVSTLLMVRLARRPRAWIGILLGVMLGLAFLAKVSALPFFALPLAAVVLFARDWRAARRALLWSALGVAIAIAISAVTYEIATQEGYGPQINSMTDNRYRVFSLGNPTVRADLARDAGHFAEFTGRYIGWPAFIVAALAPVWGIGKRRRRATLFLWLPAIAFTLAWLLVQTEAYTLPARYFTATPAPLLVLVAMGLWRGLDTLHPRRPRLAGGAFAVALAAVIGPSLWFNTALIRDLETAPLVRGDRHLYVTGLTAGHAYKEVAEDLLAVWEAGDGRPINSLTFEGYPWQVSAHLGPRTGEHIWLRPNHPFQHLTLAEWLARDEPVYVVETNYRGALPAAPLGAQLAFVKRYEWFDTRLNLYRVTGATGDLAAAIYENRAPTPDKLADRYDALAQDLIAAAPDTVLVFPAGHADALRDRGVGGVIGVEPAIWPLTPAEAESALAGIEPGEDGQTVELVQVSAEADPQHHLNLALQQRLYRVSEQWVDLLSRTTFVTGPADPQLEPVGGVWEDAITLRAAALVDPVVQPGDRVRIALAWQTAIAVQDSFAVFVHVIGPDDQLVAQYDSVPGGGFRPMTGWAVGETIAERFAVELSADTPPGNYVIRVGIYHPDHGQRLRVTDGAEVGPDHVVLGRLIVEAHE